MTKLILPPWYINEKKFIDHAIEHYLGLYFSENKNPVLKDFSETIYYSTKGGKRIRAIFALEFFIYFSKKSFEQIQLDDDITKLCVAIECLHAYSLVHDDLPCMDNDLYRRGEQTTWNKFGETNATLAGDMLNSLAFEILGQIKDDKVGMKLIKTFGGSVGFYGMIGGQVLDLYYEKNPKTLTLEKLTEIHNRKTGALITFSIISGIILSGYEGKIDNFVNFGEEIGLAFQVKDDLLEVEGTFEETGKSIGEEKKGFIHLMGIEKSKNYLITLIKNCTENIKEYNIPRIEFLVKYIGARTR